MWNLCNTFGLDCSGTSESRRGTNQRFRKPPLAWVYRMRWQFQQNGRLFGSLNLRLGVLRKIDNKHGISLRWWQFTFTMAAIVPKMTSGLISHCPIDHYIRRSTGLLS